MQAYKVSLTTLCRRACLQARVHGKAQQLSMPANHSLTNKTASVTVGWALLRPGKQHHTPCQPT